MGLKEVKLTLIALKATQPNRVTLENKKIPLKKTREDTQPHSPRGPRLCGHAWPWTLQCVWRCVAVRGPGPYSAFVHSLVGSLFFLEITSKIFFLSKLDFSSESKTKYGISTIWFKGIEFDHFSPKFDMKTPKEMDQIRAKMRPNIDATNTPTPSFYSSSSKTKVKTKLSI